MADYSDKEVLLKVENLCQFFKMGSFELKAVNNVSFEIRKGEVLGLVGESGCGKTTTGRSIIKLYDITSGNVYFKGRRICAGTRSYKEEIQKAKKNLNQAEKMCSTLSKSEQRLENLKSEKAVAEQNGNADDITKIDQEIDKLNAIINDIKQKIGDCNAEEYILKARAETLQIIESNKLEIINAKNDQKHCDNNYQTEEAKKVVEKYSPLLEEAKTAALNDAEKDDAFLKKIEEDLKNKYDNLMSNASDEKKPELKSQYAKELAEERAKTKKYQYINLKKQYQRELKRAKNRKLVTQIQMIYQDPIASLDPRMTVRDIIAEGLVIQGEKDKNAINEKVYEMLELVGLVREHASRYPHEFSGGQRQRIGVARAAIMNPELIIADEPVSALDVSIQAQVINLLNDLREKMGLTILFIAHDLSVVKYFSDRIAVMYFGQIVELASSEELFLNPLHPYTRSLLSAIPLPDPIYEKNRKRIVYNPLAEHDYSIDTPSMHEIKPGHFVFCNEIEFENYKKILK